MKRLHLSWPRRIALAALVGLVAAAASHWQVFWKQDDAVYDRWVRHWTYSPDPRLLIIAIDGPSLQQLGPWPWPRATHARLLDRLTEAGSSRVALDLLLTEPDREDASQDAELAASIRRNGHVVLPVVAVPGDRPGIAEEVLPIPMIAANAATLGHSDIEVDPDGITRGLYLSAGIGSPHWQALGAALANRRGPMPGRLYTGPAPASPWQWRRNHQVRVRYAGPAGTFPQVSYADVLHGAIDPTALRGRLVLVGMTDPTAAPPLLTPTTDARGMSGSEFQANVAAMLLDHKVITVLAAFCQALLSAVLLALLVIALTLPRARWCAALAIPTALLVSFALLRVGHVWFAPVATVACMAGVIAAWGLWRLYRWRHFANTDALTGLATRKRFEQQLQHEHQAGQRQHRPLSVVLLDVDHFKPLVDLHGQAAGNAALRAIARQITAHARRPNDITARMGQDSFALILPDTNSEGARVVVDDLVAHVRELRIPVQLGQTSQLTVSAGIYTQVPDPTSSPQSFMAGAQGALQRARSAGRDGYAT